MTGGPRGGSFAPSGIVATVSTAASRTSITSTPSIPARTTRAPPIELDRDPLALLPLRMRGEREVRRERNVATVGGEDAAVQHVVERTQLGLPIADRQGHVVATPDRVGKGDGVP